MGMVKLTTLFVMSYTFAHCLRQPNHLIDVAIEIGSRQNFFTGTDR
jgi:hypothetical protein